MVSDAEDNGWSLFRINQQDSAFEDLNMSGGRGTKMQISQQDYSLSEQRRR
jgi:hypothetical protein